MKALIDFLILHLALKSSESESSEIITEIKLVFSLSERFSWDSVEYIYF